MYKYPKYHIHKLLYVYFFRPILLHVNMCVRAVYVLLLLLPLLKAHTAIGESLSMHSNVVCGFVEIKNIFNLQQRRIDRISILSIIMIPVSDSLDCCHRCVLTVATGHSGNIKFSNPSKCNVLWLEKKATHTNKNVFHFGLHIFEPGEWVTL